MIDSFTAGCADGTGLAYVYFNYKEGELQTAENMTGSLLKQLVMCHGDIHPELLADFRRHTNKSGQPSLSELCRLLVSEIRRFAKVFIFVDALDECSQTGTMVSFGGVLSTLRHQAHILITSRLSAPTDGQIGSDSELEIAATDADIKSYLENRMQTENRLSRLLRPDASLQDMVIKQIIQNADGM